MRWRRRGVSALSMTGVVPAADVVTVVLAADGLVGGNVGRRLFRESSSGPECRSLAPDS